MYSPFTTTGLYIHCPFCAKICPYCDFAVMPVHAPSQRRWLNAIVEEARLRLPASTLFNTLYLGGGTPSSLPAALQGELMDFLATIPRAGNVWREATLECNPESCQRETVRRWKKSGVGRFSLGVQSFDPHFLQVLGRNHTQIQARQALEILLEENENCSVDLMFGLPGQTVHNFMQDLEIVLSYPIKHLSFYGLTVEPHTLFHQWQSRGKLQLPEDYDDFYLEGVARVEAAGLLRYEVSNFSVPGFESSHNLGYWKGKDWIGLGPGAHSQWGGQRLAAPRALKPWLQWVAMNCPPSADIMEKLEEKSLCLEAIWLGLRTTEGLNLAVFANKFPPGIPPQAWESYLASGWVEISGEQVRLRGAGWLHLDSLVSGLMDWVQ